MHAVIWAGAATLGYWLALVLDLGLRAPPTAAADAALYAGSLAIAASAWWSLGVGACHAGWSVLGRHGVRGVVALLGALSAVVAARVYMLANALVAGDWIARQTYAGALRVALLVILLASWHALWLWHAWGSSAQLRERVARATGARALTAIEVAFFALGLGALGAIHAALGGVLRAYAAVAEALLFPSWLLAATLAFRTLTALGAPRASALASGAVLIAALSTLGVRMHDPQRGAEARAGALSTAGLAALTEARFAPFRNEALERFDFRAAARGGTCPPAPALPALDLAPTARRNVILLSIDTMRRDAIGKRFGERVVAPNLERFGERAVFFERASAAAPGTLYSMSSLFTGHSVSQLLWQRAAPPTVFTRSASIFDRQLMVLPDWSTLRDPPFRELVRQRTPATYVSRKKDPVQPFVEALGRAREQQQRVFLWLHLVDAHEPYAPHADFDFGDSKLARYYGEVAYDDALLGRVFDVLRSGGWLDDSLIIVFSDHGESLGEAGYWGHGVSMRGRFTDVPLYVHAPGVAARVSQAPVVLTQIAPTILHFLGQPIGADIGGCSLLLSEAALRACENPVSGVYGLGGQALQKAHAEPLHTLADLERRQREVAAWRRFSPELSVTSSDHRYVIDQRTGAELLFARTDTAEAHDLAREHPELLRDFRTRVSAFARVEAQRIACDVLR